MSRVAIHTVCALLASAGMVGCAFPNTAKADMEFKVSPATAMGDEQAQIRDAQRVISYFNKLNPPLVRVDKGNAGQIKPAQAIRIPIKEALTRFVPADYKVSTYPGIDLQTIITYDQSLPWIEALGKGLAGVSLELGANMYKKAMQVKPFEATLAEVIEKHIPSGYKVFTDAEVNVDSMLAFDERQHWVEALEKSGAEAGLDITANLTRKLIVIKPLITTNKDQIKKP